MSKFSQVKRQIDRLDPENLLASHAPQDEYDAESRKISEQISHLDSPAQIAAVIAAVLLFAVCEGFVLRGFSSRAPADLDYLIVLGAQVREDGPSAVLKYRLDAAADYMRSNESVICIVTGGQGGYEPAPEGVVMKQYLTKQGIAPERILVEDRAENTVQNILFSKPLLSSSDASVGIVTNNFHVTRAMALARKQGLTNAYAIAAPSTPLYLPNNMLREFFGLTKDFLAGNL